MNCPPHRSHIFHSNFSRSFEETKDIVVDFRRACTPQSLLTVNGAVVEMVSASLNHKQDITGPESQPAPLSSPQVELELQPPSFYTDTTDIYCRSGYNDHQCLCPLPSGHLRFMPHQKSLLHCRRLHPPTQRQTFRCHPERDYRPPPAPWPWSPINIQETHKHNLSLYYLFILYYFIFASKGLTATGFHASCCSTNIKNDQHKHECLTSCSGHVSGRLGETPLPTHPNYNQNKSTAKER